MTKALYRKYRPLSLADVIGQDQVTGPLLGALKQNKIGHAYLFIGPRGTGKTSVARILAHAINNFDYELEDNKLDIIEIDAASNTGVDNIRELRERAVIAPVEGKYKIYIIDEVHMLSKSASNALLKTLEEPPAHVVFVMATTEAEKIPITISSRTQIFRFHLADLAIMASHLRQIAEREQIKITDDALELLVRRGGGSFRDTLSLLDQISTLTSDEITLEVLTNALGLPAAEAARQLLSDFAAGDAAALQAHLYELLSEGLSAENIAAELITQIIAQPTAATLPLLGKLPSVTPPFPEAKLLLALLEGQNLPIAPLKPHPKSAEAPSVAPKSAPAVPPPSAPNPAPKAPEPPQTPQKPAPPKSPQTPPAPPAEPVNSNFDWDSFSTQIAADSRATANQLAKCSHKLDGDALHLYPSNKICAGILRKPTHTQALTSHLGTGIKLVIHDADDRPADPSLAKVSESLGSVEDFAGDTPF